MVMKIPRIGDKVVMTKNVKITLQNKAQNTNFLKSLAKAKKDAWDSKVEYYKFDLKKGTELIIDRVYIRNGLSSGFDSVTFRIKDSSYLPNGRFYLPVEEANNLKVKFVDSKENKKKLTLKQYINQKHPGATDYYSIIYKNPKHKLIEANINVNIPELLHYSNKLFLDEVKRSLGQRDIDIAFENSIAVLTHRITDHPIHSVHRVRLENLINKLKTANRSLESVYEYYDDFSSFRRFTLGLSSLQSDNEAVEITNSHIFDFISYRDTEQYLVKAKDFVSNLQIVLGIINAPEPQRKYRSAVEDKLDIISELLDHDYHAFQMLTKDGTRYDRPYNTQIHDVVNGKPTPNDYISYENLNHMMLFASDSILVNNDCGVSADVDGKEISLEKLKKLFQATKVQNK